MHDIISDEELRTKIEERVAVILGDIVIDGGTPSSVFGDGDAGG